MRRKAPVGVLNSDFASLVKHGCIQAAVGSEYFVGLMKATNLNPCDGCPVWDEKGPECKAFNHLFKVSAVATRLYRPKPEVTSFRPRCNICERKIRGNNHNAHCKGRKIGK